MILKLRKRNDLVMAFLRRFEKKLVNCGVKKLTINFN